MTFTLTTKRILILCQVILISFTISLQAQTLKEIETNRISLPNGWSLTPVGKMLNLGDLPLNIAISPSKKLAAITNNGESDQTIQLVDIEREVILDSISIGKAWLGLAFSDDGKYLYASGGNDNLIIRYAIRNNHLSVFDTISIGRPWPEKISVAGLTIDDAKNLMYVVTKENNSLYVVDLQTKKTVSKHPLGGEGYTCLLSPDHKILYISCWGCDKVIVYDTSLGKIIDSIKVGDNPNDLCITGNGQYLFVANANDNSVSVIDTRQMKVFETLNSALYPDAPAGSTPNSVALSKDDKTLFIANADNNCLAVFDVRTPGSCKSKGFIPTGWYPSCVRIANNKILVSNGKGSSSLANPYGPNPTQSGEEVIYQKGGREQKVKVQYIGGLYKGNLGIINMPDDKRMALYSQAVYNNTPYIKKKALISEGVEGNPIPQKVGDPSPIKYIFYIIKENRTYDQVLGDIPEGNGDPNLVLFGENITPNQHALAREFVLLDNFYVDGEVSADGHNWSMGAYATDYMEKTWPTTYGDRGGSYDSEGSRKIANNKSYLWDYCQRYGISYRTYGEFVGDKKPSIPVLNNHLCTYYTSFDLSVSDTLRFHQWKRDFDSLLVADALPQLNTFHLGNDHTEGLTLGRPTPFAHVADNDLAVGMLLDHLSHSSVWKNSMVLIVEDDAQNGPDHVDAHRSTAYIAGGYVKKNFVDHTPYTTSSLLRTIELILGLPPMSQYDAAAVPLWRCMNNTPDHHAFNFRPCLVDLNEKNLAKNKWQRKSETFDFTKEDMVSDADFNEVIWKAVKGIDSPCPPAVRAAFFIPVDQKEED
jgi:YVTN family beta-propeller protein